MHGEEVDPTRIQNPGVVAAYLVVACILFACHRFATASAPEAEQHGAHEAEEHEKGALATAE